MGVLESPGKVLDFLVTKRVGVLLLLFFIPPVIKVPGG